MCINCSACCWREVIEHILHSKFVFGVNRVSQIFLNWNRNECESFWSNYGVLKLSLGWSIFLINQFLIKKRVSLTMRDTWRYKWTRRTEWRTSPLLILRRSCSILCESYLSSVPSWYFLFSEANTETNEISFYTVLVNFQLFNVWRTFTKILRTHWTYVLLAWKGLPPNHSAYLTWMQLERHPVDVELVSLSDKNT